MARSGSVSARPRREEAGEYRLIFMVSFAIFLMVAVIERVLPTNWRSHAIGQDSGKSIFGEAKSAALTFVPFAFMGQPSRLSSGGAGWKKRRGMPLPRR